MTVRELINIFLRLAMSGKDEGCDFAFDDGVSDPFEITSVYLDEEGDVCLASNPGASDALTARDVVEKVKGFDLDATVYFVSVGADGESYLYNIKDGGTRDRNDGSIKYVKAGDLADILCGHPADAILHFESGTVNFTVNSVYEDEYGCVCLESNEIMELDDYPLGILVEELRSFSPETRVIFYDDDSHEYYGIYETESRVDKSSDLWIKVR